MTCADTLCRWHPRLRFHADTYFQCAEQRHHSPCQRNQNASFG
ncbi:Uncharacterised protein [Vibrio cholerae]|nr:Uncharacterised protein [Vibrio cholerae]CSI55285.1 Uncharacterised protein [Vibrio cholerae]